MQGTRKGTGRDHDQKRVKTGMTVQGIPAFKKEPLKEERKDEQAPQIPEERREQAEKGNYFVYDQELGRGGMGIVYKGRHIVVRMGKRMERPVAIKEIRYEDSEISSDPELLEQEKKGLYDRFLTEVETVARLKHRNIVDIRYFGETEDGRPFYVMEHLEGTDLQNYLFRKRNIGWDEIKPIITQTCAALIAAHEYKEEEGEERRVVAKPIIHRDMKPANIFLTFHDDGRTIDRIVVLDFGLAKILTPRNPEDTFKGNKIDGTAEYMSPEQSQGLDVDHRSDIYSIGVMLYEMITGHPPFAPDWKKGPDFGFELRQKTGTQGEIASWSEQDELDKGDFVDIGDWETFRNNRFYEFRDRMTQEPPAPLPGNIPDELKRVISRCLEKRPERRYQSIRELKADIDSLNGITWAWEGALPKPSRPPENEMELPSIMVDPSLGTGQTDMQAEKTAIVASAAVAPENGGQSPWAAHAGSGIDSADLPSSHAPKAEETPADQRGVKTQLVKPRDPGRQSKTLIIQKPPSPGDSPKIRRLNWAVLGLAGAVAIGGGAATIAALRSGGQPQTESIEPNRDTRPDAQTKVQQPQRTAPPIQPLQTAETGSQEQRTYAITFTVQPSGVEIFYGGGSYLCPSRCRLTFDAGNAPINFTFRKEGYREERRRVVPDQDREIPVTLRRRAPRTNGQGGQGSGSQIIITSPD